MSKHSKPTAPVTTPSEHEPRADQMTIPGVEVTASATAVQNDDGTYTLGKDAVTVPVTVEGGTVVNAPATLASPVPPKMTDEEAAEALAKIEANKAKGKGGKGGKGKGEPKPSKSAADLADKAEAAAKAAREKIIAEKHHTALMSGWKPTEVVNLPVGDDKKLTFDKRLQMRALGKQLATPAVVEEYKNHMLDHIARAKEDGKTPEPGCGFPPLRAIRITDNDRDANKLPGNVIVFGGFHRGDAAFQAGVKTFPVEVMDGTFKFARLLALGENRHHGLQRTDEDRKRAFYALIDDPEMMADALELARTGGSGREGGKGGLNRALSHITGLAKGSISNYLGARGLTTSGDKIVKKREKPADKTEEEGDDGTTTTTDATGGTSTTYTSAPSMTPEQLKAQASIDVVEAMERLQASFERQLGEILTRDDARDLFIAAAKTYGYPIEVTETQENGETVYQTSWSVMSALTLILESVKTELTQAKIKAGEGDAAK